MSQTQRQRVPKDYDKPKKKKPEKEIRNFVQDFIPIKEIRNGIIQTIDKRYIKILEIEKKGFSRGAPLILLVFSKKIKQNREKKKKEDFIWQV